MFIRLKKRPSGTGTAIQIVDNTRDANGKVKQKVIRHVGLAHSDSEIERLKDMATFIKVELQAQHQPFLLPQEEVAQSLINSRRRIIDQPLPIDDLRSLQEEQRVITGIHDVYGAIYRQLGFDKVIHNASSTHYSPDYLYHLVMARIANPQSKRQSVHMLEKDFGITLNLDWVYRTLDRVDDGVIERIRRCSLKAAQTLFPDKVDVLFYDATTLYFESFTEGELHKNGFSKDGKHNQPQVLLAIIVTSHGIPIGYETFEGNMYEGHTLEVSLSSLKKRFDVGSVVLVADSGLLSKDNMEWMETGGFQYIVGARLKNTPKALHDTIQNVELFTDVADSDMKWLDHSIDQGRRLIVRYSASKARKDRYDREKAVIKAKKKLETSNAKGQMLSKGGYKKYLSLEGESKVVLNQSRMDSDAKWDGLHGVITNIKGMEPTEVIGYYKGLWQVEESFRVTKHDLRIRPIFHWTKSRIQAHIAMCYMALTCVRHLEYRVSLKHDKMSPEVIRNALIHVQVSVLKHQETGRKYGMPSRTTADMKRLYQAVGRSLSGSAFMMVD